MRRPGGGARPSADGSRAPAPPGGAPGAAARPTQCARRRVACAGRPRGGCGPQGEGVFGRDEAEARPRTRARPRPPNPLPRRADDRPRHPEPDGAVGRGGRLAKDEGVTVFLTTQYLEEADVLADRIGIIDHGHIVAEGSPAELKAEVGRPTVEVMPSDPSDEERVAEILANFGEPVPAIRGVARACAPARPTLPRSSARSTPRSSRSSNSSSISLRSTTSSWRRPAARSKARVTTRTRSPRRLRWSRRETPRRPDLPARPPLGRADGSPAGERDRAGRLPAHAPRGQLRRAQGRDAPAGISDHGRRGLPARRPVHPGRPVRHDEHRHRPGA